MNRRDPLEVAAALDGLGLWDKAAAFNWALVSQLEVDPVFVSVMVEKTGPVKARLMLFPGIKPFTAYVLARTAPDVGVALGTADFTHDELVVTRTGEMRLFSCEPGFIPVPPVPERLPLIASFLYECYGFFLRLEEEPEFPAAFARSHANTLFARKEGLDGKWSDFALPMPERPVPEPEQIVLVKAECEAAEKIPVEPDDAWELDFMMLPGFSIRGPRTRFLYLLAAVDAKTGERIVWERLAVAEDGAGGLERIWEKHAERVMRAILKRGRAPGEIRVRSERLVRFLRPLGFHIPFRLVRNAELSALSRVVREAVQNRSI